MLFPWLKKLSFTSLTLAAFALLTVLLAVLGWTTVTSLQEAGEDLRDVYVEHVLPYEVLAQLMGPVRDISFRMAGFIAGELPAAGCNKKLEESAAELKRSWQEFLAKSQADDQVETETKAAVTRGMEKFADFVPKLSGAYGKSDVPAATKLFEDELPSIQSALFSPIQKLMELRKESVRRTYEEAYQRARTSRRNASIMVAFAVLVIFLAGMIVRKMTQQLRVYGRKTLELGDESRSLGELSTGFLDSSAVLAHSSTQQAAKLEETSAAMTEMDQSLRANATSTAETAEAARICREATLIGQKAMGRMLQSIEEMSQSNGQILTHVEDGNRKISEIVRVIEEIGAKTKVINDIVFQTKLLSFNASVEAARAGEHGRGFSVVAEEIGSLAAMSGTAAREISSILGSSIDRVNGIIVDMSQGIQRVIGEGNSRIGMSKTIAAECDASLNGLVANVTRMAQTIESVSDSIRQQSRAISSVSEAIAEASGITQQTSVHASQIAASAKELAGKSTEMGLLVNDLSSLVKSADAA